jgi:hypothetical protein
MQPAKEGARCLEGAVLVPDGEHQLRQRTVKAVTSTELCYLTREKLMHELSDEYPELKVRKTPSWPRSWAYFSLL